MKVCSVMLCDRKATRKGMCQLHYRRFKVHGDTSVTNRRKNGDGKGYRGINGKGLHVQAAEKALGRPLPPKAVVHHVNEDRSDNRNENLVICENAAYHSLIHMRMRALKATGHADWRKCKICHQYSPPSEITILKSGSAHHLHCNRAHVAKYARRKA